MTIPNRNINFPTAIKFGAGRIKELAELCAANGIKRPLFVTDPGLAWTGVKETGRGATLSKIGYETLTRPKSFHLRDV
jgi:alcohol dehydrogenase class IV